MTAMMGPAIEGALYDHFTAFFRQAEENRRWDLWNDVPWDAANPNLSDDLTEAVEAAYAEELFLPDWSAQLIRLLRGSRGRAWFLTRWSYEEGKHLLALREWLLRSGKRDDEVLKGFSDRLLSEGQWRLPHREPITAMVQALVREHAEIERYRALLACTEAEGDAALAAVLRQFLRDEQAHQAFFRDALLLIREHDAAGVTEAVERVATQRSAQRFVPALRDELAVPAR